MGLKATARLAGRVQGVVVQIRTKVFGSPLRRNFTYTLWLMWSLYSTSASASAVLKGMLQYTGFLPRYTKPFSTRSAKSPSSAAS